MAIMCRLPKGGTRLHYRYGLYKGKPSRPFDFRYQLDTDSSSPSPRLDVAMLFSMENRTEALEMQNSRCSFINWSRWVNRTRKSVHFVAGGLVSKTNRYTDATKWTGFRVRFRTFMKQGDNMDSEERTHLDQLMKEHREFCISKASVLFSTQNKMATGL